MPTLVAVDNPRNLTWRGRSNLYSRMRSYLEPTGKAEGAEAIDDFNRWKETPTEAREVDSILAFSSVWKSAKPLQDLLIEQENPTQAFHLAEALLKTAAVGARVGPFGERLVEAVRSGDPKIERPSEDARHDPGRAVETADRQSSHPARLHLKRPPILPRPRRQSHLLQTSQHPRRRILTTRR